MGNKIEALELQNQDLKGEVSQLKERMAQMFQILSQTNVAIMTMANHDAAGHAQVGNTIGPLPHLNIEDPINEEQEQPKAEAQHQATQTTQPFVVHKQTPQMKDKWQSLEEQLRVVEGGNMFGVEAVDLCLVLDVGLPADFKTLKFDKYKGSSCPRVHLVMYYRKMAAYIYDDKILIHYFQDSLTRETLSWYVSLERGCIETWRDLA
ncbi:hypothetical protein CR513_08490, partial [Mucuna pruriens]